ncbi:type II secretion system GspH family protein [Sulfurimonas sp. SWIR-19]|uniref:type II secretion system protein n=1 Tax=Sulfurimonas sp. SWIR-19 TaxID=2878390 RepID=UPI001CF4CBA2|nr:type II secretion system protein [Sulfurimonas sp. SWIR-19]UCN00665.1 type II secretion system GspH family protein [Sulfurimonas sp. SWIR-19]
MKKSKQAFTMIELVFVIVVLGILASIAIPKFAATRTDAQISKARADIASVRSAILTDRQAHIIKGDPDYISGLSQNSTTLFDGNGTRELLMYGIKAGNTDGHWSTTDNAAPYLHYVYKVGGKNCAFTYSPTTGRFDLNTGQDTICDKLVD